MSHVAKIELEVKDLAALETAAERIGMELRKGQTSFRWYGNHVGDYPLPEGFTKEDMGRCEHALRVTGKPSAYEIGVCPRRDGKPGYVLLWDFFAGGHGLIDAVGKSAEKLKQAYGVEAAKNSLRRQGFQKVQEVKLANGAVRLRYSRR